MLSRSSRPKWDPRNWLRSSREFARSPQRFPKALAEECQGRPKAFAKESPQKCSNILFKPYKISPQVPQGSPPRQHPGMAKIPHGHRAAQQSGCQGAGHPGKKNSSSSPRNLPGSRPGVPLGMAKILQGLRTIARSNRPTMAPGIGQHRPRTSRDSSRESLKIAPKN